MERMEQAINMIDEEKRKVIDELIFHLGQNTYMMPSFYRAGDRRSYEDFKVKRVAELLKNLGFEVNIEDEKWMDGINLRGKMVEARKGDLYIEYWIRCTCRNIYKKKTILFNGEKKDIRFLRKFLNEECKI